MSEPVAKYNCPICSLERCAGHFPEGSYWTSRCSRCRTYYRYASSVLGEEQVDVRCPYCNRLQMRGVFPLGSWAEMRCKCRKFIYFSNSVAYVSKFGREALMPKSPPDEGIEIDYWAPVEVVSI